MKQNAKSHIFYLVPDKPLNVRHTENKENKNSSHVNYLIQWQVCLCLTCMSIQFVTTAFCEIVCGFV